MRQESDAVHLCIRKLIGESAEGYSTVAAGLRQMRGERLNYTCRQRGLSLQLSFIGIVEGVMVVVVAMVSREKDKDSRAKSEVTGIQAKGLRKRR